MSFSSTPNTHSILWTIECHRIFKISSSYGYSDIVHMFTLLLEALQGKVSIIIIKESPSSKVTYIDMAKKLTMLQVVVFVQQNNITSQLDPNHLFKQG